MKFLIVGLGSIGRRHLKNLVLLGEKDIVLCRKKTSTLPDGELDSFIVETNIERALDHKPDAVIISNPTSLHMDIAIPAAEAGCSILLEKPISNSLQRIEELKASLKRGGGQVLVGFQFRFHPTLNLIKDFIDEEKMGNPVFINSNWGEYLPDWHPWEDFHNSYAARADLGGGVVLTLCHPFDYLNWFMGNPEVTYARTATIGNFGLEVEDLADVNLTFANGALGTVHLDYLQKPTNHCINIICTRGSMQWNNADGNLYVYSNENSKYETFTTPKGFERNQMFIEEMKHFIKVVRKEVTPLCTLDDGVTALDIALKILLFRNSIRRHDKKS